MADRTWSRTRIATALVAAALLAALGTPAAAQTPLTEAQFSAYATGTVTHVGAVGTAGTGGQQGTRLVDTDVAFSGATVSGAGLAQQRVNEFGTIVQPAQQGKNSYGRGVALTAGVNREVPGQNEPLLTALVEAAAAPNSDPPPQEVGPVDADPVAFASTARGDAMAVWPPRTVLGDLSFGLGYVEDAELVDLGGQEQGEGLEQPLLSTNVPDQRAVSWSVSRTGCGGQTGGAVVAETRQTIAPVTFFAGQPGMQFTLETLGEWVLRAEASGKAGGAKIHYGPGTVTPETPLLRIIRLTEQGEQIENILTSQDLFGEEGLVIEELPGASIVVGEDPRKIGGDAGSEPVLAANGTLAAAAVDVVRVRLNVEGLGDLADVRVGHMEVLAQAPVGGVECGVIPVRKSVTPETVRPGQAFTYTIDVLNPHPCDLINVRVVDTITADPGIDWSVTGTRPEADEVSDERIVWNDVGPIRQGGRKTLSISARLDSATTAGLIRDRVEVTGICRSKPVAGRVGVDVPLRGRGGIDLPEVVQPVPELPRTGAASLLTLGGLGLTAGALLLLRRRR